MLIKVRDSKGKVFSNDTSNFECIIEIHFCTSYTQVVVQEKDVETDETIFRDIIIPIENKNNLEQVIDMIAVKSDEIGSWEASQ
ncbi:hypothetical protein P7H62_15430 [Vagococcus carniphilus]|uniref:hypothetical protein n=1 Tax=Vagococcus carniphilus TaxID=218144 RepID=UPI00288D342E|nr:hypothetical protein [Vagococcus carniphilus]MDT2832378.1 hypothetical protein [Vagococcus carniphilus]MDT2840735.1 hypothetical protein [Vagococcus carniphilus]MDT2855810.1 hypothetical protein [Vagococcus carniphilus]